MKTRALAAVMFLAAPSAGFAQSIWDLAYDADPEIAQGGGNPYADAEAKPRTFAKGDIITVMIEENARARMEAKAEADSSTSVEATLDNFIRFTGSGANRKLVPAYQDRIKPEIGFESQLEIEKQARNERRHQYSDRISCEVIYVHPNGNLAIEGRKIRHLNGEMETVALSGIISPRDIDKLTNSVRSERVAQARITFTGEGDVSDWAIFSWFQKLLGKIWPF